MPLSFIGSMMFGGAFLNSYLSDKAAVSAYKSSLANSIILKHAYSCEQVEYIRKEIWELFEKFVGKLKHDTLIPDMIAITSHLHYKDVFPQTDHRYYRYNEKDLDGHTEPYSYYNWWEKMYDNVTVQIYPEISSEYEAYDICGQIAIDSLAALAEENIYPIDSYIGSRHNRTYYYCENEKATKAWIEKIKLNTDYHPPLDNMNAIESAYHNYHFNHPIKTWDYLVKSTNPLHQQQINYVRQNILQARLLTVKQWQDRLVYEYKGQVPDTLIKIDYFLRWCARQKIEIYPQEQRAFFNCHIPDENTINYGDERCIKHNALTRDEQLKVLMEDILYLGKLHEMRTGESVIGDYYGMGEEWITYDLSIPLSTEKDKHQSASSNKKSFWQKLFGD